MRRPLYMTEPRWTALPAFANRSLNIPTHSSAHSHKSCMHLQSTGGRMFITKKHLSRRTVLRGLGAAVALPFLESMMPAAVQFRKTAAGQQKVRLACLEMVHGAAGSTRYGDQKNMWAPAAAGR